MENTVEAIYSLFLKSNGISTDTRKIDKGKIYFALKGANFNGNSFAAAALEQGAIACVVDEPQLISSAQFFLVEDVLKTLQDVAGYHRKQLNIPFFAITGSNGKTTSKELCAAVLSKKYKTLYTKGNLNNHIGVPLTLLEVTREHEFAVIEMGANHQGEIAMLAGICEPTHGLITNVGKAHLEGFGGFKGVVKGKTELYRFLEKTNGKIFCNSSNRHLYPLCKGYKEVITYGTGDSAWIQGRAEESEFLTVHWKEEGKGAYQGIRTHLTGTYNLENVLAAVCTGKYFGVADELIKDAIESYYPSNQRSQVIKAGSNTIILDAYNANPTSMTAALNNLSGNYKGEKVVILGDMFELGEDSLAEHKHVLNESLKVNASVLALVGKWFDLADTGKEAIHFTSSGEARDFFKSKMPHNSTVLIKGSRSSKMEVVLEAFSDSIEARH